MFTCRYPHPPPNDITGGCWRNNAEIVCRSPLLALRGRLHSKHTPHDYPIPFPLLLRCFYFCRVCLLSRQCLLGALQTMMRMSLPWGYALQQTMHRGDKRRFAVKAPRVR